MIFVRSVVAVLALIALSAHAQPTSSASPLLLGTAWYPEQWPEQRWEADLALMERAHIHVVRVAEFAWSSLEPSEGRFDFGWLDRAIDLAAKHHIVVVLGTPTAAPPAWLTARYPQTLRVEEDGRLAEHGNRQQFSANDPKYRLLAARIAHEMATRYGHNAHVIGWQIDNEIAAPTFDESARTQWHQWLQHKYGTVAKLNELWTTSYWSQTYDNFDEVPLHSKGENPALLLDYKHFVTDTWISYVQNQVDAIRPLADARQFITTNTMHWNSTFDHYVLHRSLDIAAWDDYFPDGHLDPMFNAAMHDLVRGYKGRNFWVMETQPAFVNWGAINAALPPGVTREMAWQAVGHGADAVLYWQWRSALNGQEQYHGSLLGADGLPVPVYSEIERIGAEFDRVNDALARNGTSLTSLSPHGSIALLQSYDSHWAIDFQRHSNKFDYVGSFMDFYRSVAPLAQSVDIVAPDAQLTSYPIVFAPALNVVPDAIAKHLLDYVQDGGTLVLGPRSGMKTAVDGLQPNRQPGPLEAALGATVAQYYALDAPVQLTGDVGSGKASVWAEDLKPERPGVKTLLTYGEGNGWLAGHPAAVIHAFGKGKVVYIGSDLDPALMTHLASKLLKDVSVSPIIAGLPPEVEVMERSSSKGRVQIFINHSSQPQPLYIKETGFDLLTGKDTAPSKLDAHGVAVWLVTGKQ